VSADRRLAAILAADVSVSEHRNSASENRANGSFPKGACKTPQGVRGQEGL
jgi:hypothetical protein